MKINTRKILLTILIILAIFMRLYKWQKFDMYAGDEGIQLLYAEDILNFDYFPVTGEISSLDQDNTFFFHNSPIGIYFQTFLYLISFKSIHIYSLTYVILNLLTCYFIYKSIKYLSSENAALIGTVIMLFSPFMLHASIWTSQPVNSLIFESLAIYLFTRYCKSKNENLFLISSISSLIATQMYPPMYLLLIPKIILFVYIFINKVKNKKKILISFILISTLIYLPFLLMEYKYNQINLRSISSVIENFKEPLIQDKTTISIPYFQKAINLIKKVIGYLSSAFRHSYLFILLYSFFAYLISFSKSNLKDKKILLSSISIAFAPILILLILFNKPSVSSQRAYVDIVFPFIVILFSIIHKKINHFTTYFIVFIYLIVTILPMKDYFFIRNNDLTNFSTLKKSVQYITTSSKAHEISYPNIHVISNGDYWGWDSSIYWYLLEKEYDKNLVSINFYTSKAEILEPEINNEYIYLICHSYNDRECFNDWKIIENSRHYSSGKFIIVSQQTIDQNTIFLLNSFNSKL